jgi:flavin-dependent dehydrogenase
VDDCFDVGIVGAGPSGATCAWYLARQGKRVLLLEKKQFPRDKLCGEAICASAQVHLKRMGVLQAVLAENQGRWAEVGGLVSPSGIRFIGNSARHAKGSLVVAIKRIILDEKIARAAVSAGAQLVENYAVRRAEFSPQDGCWSLFARQPNQPAYRARVLVAADGASSSLARSLNLVTSPPDAVCSRAYVKAGTAPFAEDGVVYYPARLLPGYCALFREAGDELIFCCYVIPGGKAVPADLRRLHDSILRTDPHVREALGPNAVIDPMKGAPLRLGGVPRSYADHVLILGDAAGHIDPLTGEGIQYGMDAAEIAAQTLEEAFAASDLSAGFLQRYQERWRKAFGRDFAWSRKMSLFSARFPIFLDAWAAATRRRGDRFLTAWAEIMTGSRPKRDFFRPRIVWPILLETGLQLGKRLFPV